jgi:Domain of unknown function (DUF4386)
MTAQTFVATAAEPDGTLLYRVGGISALLLGVGYSAIFPVYASVGAPPSGGEAWLEYSAGKTGAWSAILALSVVTDLLFIPIALALYLALRAFNRDAMLLATSFVLLFVVLDLAVTWSNYAALIALGDSYAAATTDAQRAAYVAAASYPSALLKSTLEGVYSIVTLAVGMLIIGLVMLRSTFSPTAAWLGVATGILGIVSVGGPLVVSGLSNAVILASVLTTIWALVVGYRLVGLGRP